jgi:hypothetical protein
MAATIPQIFNIVRYHITPQSFMKFCPVVPEICRGQVHGPRKERRKRIIIIIIITRYDYNLTIMKWSNSAFSKFSRCLPF